MNELNPSYCHGDGHLEDKRNFIGNSDLFCRVIENTDGVPFQIIFGPGLGEGCFINPGAGVEQLFGVAPGDFSEKLYLSMIERMIPLTEGIPSDIAGLRKSFLEGSVQNYRAELLIKLPSGEKKWIHDASVPLTDEETGRVIGAFGIFHDITWQKHSSVISRTGSRGAVSLESAFLRNISHEIRTPLNAIVGFSALLSEEGHDPVEEKVYREMITTSTDRLLEVVSNILELTKVEAGTLTIRMANVNPADLLDKVYYRLLPEAEAKGLVFNKKIPGIDGVSISADQFRLEQVLLQVAGNAVKFTPRGRVDLGYEIKDKGVEFFVADTGIGIAEEHQARVYDKFYQAESSPTRNYGGAGIGLTIAKEYIELMGGSIWFSTVEGKGTEFRVRV